MAIFPVTKFYMDPMRWQTTIRNGLQPDWRSAAGVVDRTHFALCHSRKLVFMKTTRPGNTPQGSAGTVVPWRWYFYTGEDVASGSTIRLRAQCLVLPGDTSGTDPRFQIDLNSGGITSNVGRYPLVDGSPDYGQLQRVEVTCVGLAPNTAYAARLDLIDYARVVAMTVHEEVVSNVDTSGTYVSDPRVYASDLPITDAQHQEYIQDLHTIWKHGGAPFFSLVPDDVASQWTRTTNSAANVLDQSITSVTASTPGFNVQATYQNPFHSTSIPCIFAAYGTMAGGVDGEVSLHDSSGEMVVLTVGSAGWYTGTVNLTGGAVHKVDVYLRGDDTNQLTLEAVCLFPYVT